MDTIYRYYKVESRHIVLFKSILEGYEGLVVVRTVHADTGIIQLLISPDLLNDLETILAHLRSTMRIIPISDSGLSLVEDSNNPFYEDEGYS